MESSFCRQDAKVLYFSFAWQPLTGFKHFCLSSIHSCRLSDQNSCAQDAGNQAIHVDQGSAVLSILSLSQEVMFYIQNMYDAHASLGMALRGGCMDHRYVHAHAGQASSQRAMSVQVEDWPPHTRHCHPSGSRCPSRQHLDDR